MKPLSPQLLVVAFLVFLLLTIQWWPVIPPWMWSVAAIAGVLIALASPRSRSRTPTWLLAAIVVAAAIIVVNQFV